MAFFSRIKIRIPQLEISNKPEPPNSKIKIQNDLGKTPKSEYRNPKQFQNLNSQNPKPFNENFSRVFKCFEISILSFPFLFRVSDFVLRICNFIYTWRALRLGGSPYGISFPQTVYLFIHGLIPRGEPRGIPTRPRSSFSTEAIFHRASHLFPDSLIQ